MYSKFSINVACFIFKTSHVFDFWPKEKKKKKKNMKLLLGPVEIQRGQKSVLLGFALLRTLAMVLLV